MNGFLLVALGGGLGASLRHGCGVAARLLSGTPGLHATLFVNLVGSALMGILIAWIATRPHPEAWRDTMLFLGTGLLGGFTTYSAFSMETVALMQSGAHGRAFIYVIANAAGSVSMFWAAFALARRVLA